MWEEGEDREFWRRQCLRELEGTIGQTGRGRGRKVWSFWHREQHSQSPGRVHIPKKVFDNPLLQWRLIKRSWIKNADSQP